MLAFIEMERGSEKKAMDLAEKCLELNSDNIYARMISLMCSKS
jgi:hypothetical protein